MATHSPESDALNASMNRLRDVLDEKANKVMDCTGAWHDRIGHAELIAAAKVEVLNHLIGVAQATNGAEVWRALFAEMRTKILDGK